MIPLNGGEEERRGLLTTNQYILNNKKNSWFFPFTPYMLLNGLLNYFSMDLKRIEISHLKEKHTPTKRIINTCKIEKDITGLSLSLSARYKIV